MRHPVWFAVLVGLTGFYAPAVGQTVDPDSQPDPSGFLQAPVVHAPNAPKAKSDGSPIRRVAADEVQDDLPPPGGGGSSGRMKPLPPVSRSKSRTDDDAPPTRRSAPKNYDDDSPPPRPRYDDETTPPWRRGTSRNDRGDDETTPPRKPRPRYDDDESPAPAPRKSRPRNDDDEGDPPPPPRKKRYYDDDTPAATLAKPTSDGRTVSDRELTEARTAGEGKKKPIDLIQYLTSDGDTPTHKTTRNAGLFGHKFTDVLGEKGNGWFCSDSAFETFTSPISNPFLFEDPRSLTEVRPIFIYQRVPSKEPVTGGGNMYFIGAQGRIAFTDRLSVVINKFGGQGLDPSSNVTFDKDHFGLAELWLGPKYTFIRNTETGSLLAGGLQFQIPLGSANVYQNTGTLSVVPYATYGQNFLRSRAGSFNGLIGTGYSFSTNNERSDYYYLSAHLDYDIANTHRFYPVAEMNWFYNTTNGTSTPWRFEGRDLINFGSQAKGSNLLTGALGGRIKVTKSLDIGAVFELPLAGNKDLFDYRWTVDFIWRY